ncbi:unnamed protein product, partial [Meganyctiphanes norvegica]
MAADIAADDLSLLARFADLLGAPEPALRLLLSILVVSLILNARGQKRVWCQTKYFHVLYATLPIILKFGFGYGSSIIHSAVCTLVAWLGIVMIGGTVTSVLFAFLFQMTYLLAGYYYTGTDTYDIKWSMPHCVLTLRLIALTYDVYDGKKDPAKLSKDQQKTALPQVPSLLEVTAHTYFPASFLVGPQFSMRRYLDFVKGTLVGYDLPGCVTPGLLRGSLGMFYLVVYQIGIAYFPDEYINSPAYNELPFWQRHFVVGIWAKVTLYKYISCWLIAEGVCIMSGLSYSGEDSVGVLQWRGCANVKVRTYEGATTFGHMIASFNTNTNAWVAQYIYKRLRFLNNRYLSQIGALVFLAVWHGLHSGYYACFFMEFVVMKFEKDLASMVNRYPRLVMLLNAGPLKYVKLFVLKLYVVVFMGYCLGPFVLLKLHKWWSFWQSLYFSGHIFFVCWPLYAPAVRAFLKVIGGPPVTKDSLKQEVKNSETSTAKVPQEEVTPPEEKQKDL